MEGISKNDVELRQVAENGRNGTGNEAEIQTLVENVDATNGVSLSVNANAEAQTHNGQKKGLVSRVKQELRLKVCGRVPLWVVLILVFVLVICLVFASLALCSALYTDPDDTYDAARFNVGRSFCGSFRLPNWNSTDTPPNPATNESRTLAAELQERLDALYTHSPALGRYFSRSEIHDFSDPLSDPLGAGPLTARFCLRFRMPADEEGVTLAYFTLSREVVYNVLRQYLHEQEVGVSQRSYIEPASLHVSPEQSEHTP